MILDWVLPDQENVELMNNRRMRIPGPYKTRAVTYGDLVGIHYDFLQHAGDEGWNPNHFEMHDANGEIVDVYFSSKGESQWAHSCSLPLTQCSILWPQSWQ